MKIYKILILVGAAWAGAKLYHALTDVPQDSGPEGRSTYSSVTGSGSLWQTFQSAREQSDSSQRWGNQQPQMWGSQQPYAAQGVPAGGIGNIGNPYEKPQQNSSFGRRSYDQKIPDNDIALLDAASRGDADLLEKRLLAHAKVDSRDGWRRTPLMLASWGGHDEIINRLIAAGANINLEDRDGNKAFDYAAGRGLVDIVRLLLKRTDNSDDHHYIEYATIIQAAYTGDPSHLPPGDGRLASVNRINSEGQAPLDIAAGNGAVALAEILLKRGAHVDVTNDEKQTPLHWAAWNNQPAMVDLLLSHNADIEAKDITGNTALMLAAEGGNTDVVKLLLARGADKYAANKAGKTAAIIANEKRHKNLADLLN